MKSYSVVLNYEKTTKVEEFRPKKEVIKAQYTTAEAQVRIKENLTGISEETTDVDAAMNKTEDKTEQMKAKAKGTRCVIKILQAEANLVQSNLASNVTLAQDHANSVVDVVNGNHTFGVLPDEVSENNKRGASSR